MSKKGRIIIKVGGGGGGLFMSYFVPVVPVSPYNTLKERCLGFS